MNDMRYSKYIGTVSSQCLLSTLLIQFELVYRPFGQNNMLSMLVFCSRSSRKKTNVNTRDAVRFSNPIGQAVMRWL